MQIPEEALKIGREIVKLGRRILQAGQQIKEKTLELRAKNKKVFTYSVGGIALGLLIITLNIGINSSLKAYEIQMEDTIVALVRNEEDFTQALDKVKLEVQTLYGHELAVPQNIEIIKTKAKKKEITDEETIKYKIKKQLDMKVKAVAITVDGQVAVYLKDKANASALLEEIKKLYIEEDINYDEIGFSEKVILEEAAVAISEIKSKDDAFQLITKGTDEEKIHEVAPGESAWLIARNYDLRVADIEAANPGINPERLKIGQEISLVVPKPYISVKTKEYIELVEEIPFETEYEETDSLYKGDKKITVQGLEGERAIKGYLIKQNGLVTDREIIEEKILSEPKTRVIAEGTKPRPATVATGIFNNPSRGSLTSGFGMRWGRRHEGIDIANSTGTPIMAADAGKVSFAGYKGSYGNLVIINHENGYQTYYAHCSKILVKSGTRVYKGQEIARVGSTGRSTGPHLHFEVRKNGSPINPLQFVKY